MSEAKVVHHNNSSEQSMLEKTNLEPSANLGQVVSANDSVARIVVARGDGIGPEIMDATLRVLRAAGAKLDIAEIKVGKDVYLAGNSSGIEDSSWDVLRERRVFLKAPITTPQGGGYKSLNVTMRKSLGLYANIRPCVAYAPFVATRHPAMDIVMIRENEEDLYAGIEHRQTDDVVQCLKIITRQGCERIMRYAFEYARANGRKKVTCMTKDNIMKMSDGLFHKVFDEVGAEYPELAQDHMIIDIGMARVVDAPEKFDVIVTLNLYGDILSDITAEMAGSVGLAGSSNVGSGGAMFEAIHGTAPDIAGQDKANPSGLLNASVMMLHHVGQGAVANRVANAWLATIEDGIHTGDIVGEKTVNVVGTREFADAVIERLGRTPQTLKAVSTTHVPTLNLKPVTLSANPAKKDMVGVDVFVEWRGDAESLAAKLNAVEHDKLKLSLITSRGVKVWPNGIPETSVTDHWRCRFMPREVGIVRHREIAALLDAMAVLGIDFIKTESLCMFDGKPGYSLGQGQ
jgi:isocitrate dehydrogenase